MSRNRLIGLLVTFVLMTASCVSKEITVPAKIEPPPPPKPAKIALVLGAGSSKGFAHVGVLKVLETNKVPIHMIIGTSVGSAVGSLYAYGYNAFQLQKISFSIEKGDVVDLIIPDNGFIKGEKLEEFINKTLNYTPMEKLKIPFYAVATDVQSGQEVVFGRGNTGQAVRASCSIPGVFRPVKIGERVYVDGGVVSPVAVDAAKRLGADVVIAVDISKDDDRTKPEGTMETIFQSLNIMYSKLASIQVTQADIVIRPKVGYINSSDFSKRHEAILEGEKAAVEALPQIRGILAQLQRDGRLEESVP
ncbi:MAG TPA: patatin-like phospholipase family protein [Thermodesulfobacteriota bacterium]|nr:patatin-like phospholipase family protein [Thermodesulfobacteriota bacterium]